MSFAFLLLTHSQCEDKNIKQFQDTGAALKPHQCCRFVDSAATAGKDKHINFLLSLNLIKLQTTSDTIHHFNC